MAEARALVGAPWIHLGRTPNGVDCVGLVALAAERAGFGRADLPVYSRVNDAEQLLALAANHLEPKTGPLEPGDVVVLRLAREPRHFAIVGDYPGGGLTLIHARNRENGRGCVVEHRLDDDWRARIYLTFRPRAS